MGNLCLRPKATQVAVNEPEIPQTKVEAREAKYTSGVTYVEITKTSDSSQHWLNSDLTTGSSVRVGTSDIDNYWVWERYWENGEPQWRFRVNIQENLYLAYNEASNGVEVWPSASDNPTFFTVDGGQQGGFIFRVPGKQKFIAESGGKLILSETATEWALIVDEKANRPEAIVKDILIIKEYLGSKKWACGSATQGSSVVVDLDYAQSKQSQWLRQYDLTEDAWLFQSRQDDNLFVTCATSESEISLKIGTNENIKERLLKGKGQDALTLLDNSGTKYFFTKDKGLESILALTDDASDATSWQFQFYGFEVDGKVFPPDVVRDCQTEESKEEAPDDQNAQLEQTRESD